MTRISALFLTTMFLACAAPSTDGEEAGNAALSGGRDADDSGYVTTAPANLREQPNLSARILGVMPKGTPVLVTTKAPTNGFYAVSWNSKKGWVHGGLLKPEAGSKPLPGADEGPADVGGPTTATGEWSWMLARDFGLRDDSSGGGAFGAARNGNAGGHSGIDFLAPIGTELRAVCDATNVFASSVSGYGQTVILACPLPTSLSGGANVWVSVLYGHLSAFSVSNGGSVKAGQPVGKVGKTGNAVGAGINPHVHFEIALHGSEAAARAESHSSSDHSASAGSAQAMASIKEGCTVPLGIQTKQGPLNKGRRPDPFVLVTCLAKKPKLETAPASTQSQLFPWSGAYSATFDVNVGR